MVNRLIYALTQFMFIAVSHTAAIKQSNTAYDYAVSVSGRRFFVKSNITDRVLDGRFLCPLDRQTDRQTDRQIDRQTDRQTDR